ncbi:MAG: T9SS type A sorting domain-containing protein [Flavobacteriaceae bacterium]|jgi:hypothetical protein|nr:T9SS type A sorting domain-containing protein [Flavobacteriaceae bacterium]
MKKILFPCFLALSLGANAQITGTKIIGTDYPTLNDAFADLNTNGVGTGGVTINIPAGYTETPPAGGFSLGTVALNATLSAANPLIIQKSGTGANPLFTAYTGTNPSVESFFKFFGVDYMTIDGIDLQESPANTTAAALIEKGFAFYNLSSTDGCNYNMIQNCTITFTKVLNNQAVGVYFAHTNGFFTPINPTSIDGMHSNNKIYGNTIVNTQLYGGVYFMGYADAAPYNLYDQNNDVGGNAPGMGNTFIDCGGMINDAAYLTNYAVYAANQNNLNVSNNTIDFVSGGLGTVGIYVSGINSTFTANNNTIDATGQVFGNTGALYHGIYSDSAGTNLTANNNDISVLVSEVYGGNGFPEVTGIKTSGNDFTAQNNIITGSAVGSFYGIYSAASGSIDISSNQIGNATGAVGVDAGVYGVYMEPTGTTSDIVRNKIYNLQSNDSNSETHGIYIAGSAASATTNIVNNLIGDLRAPLSDIAAPSISGIYLAATGTTSNLNLYYNSIYLNATSFGTDFGTTGIYHISDATATTATLDLRNNIVVNLSTPKGTGRTTAFRRSASDMNNYANTSNNNDFYVGNAANSNIYYDGTTAYNFADFQTAVAPRETAAQNINAAFLSTDGTNPDFLKPDETNAQNQPLDNKGAAINGYTTDYAGATRNAITPDMGAYEFTVLMATSEVNKNRISVYPNPTTGILKISDVKDVASITIVDMTGRTLKTFAPSSELNLSNLVPGAYIVNLKMTNSETQSVKMIKQ